MSGFRQMEFRNIPNKTEYCNGGGGLFIKIDAGRAMSRHGKVIFVKPVATVWVKR